MTVLYLAFSGAATDTLARHVGDGPVDLLVAYPELRSFQRSRHLLNVRHLAIDSGAFSVHNSGKTINLEAYIEACGELSEARDIFGLDVIGDHAATRKNLETMWSAGIPAIPTYHIGSPREELMWCAQHARKMALGGVAKVGKKIKADWLESCMREVWPKPVHAFGAASLQSLLAAPFDSADASSWTLAPAAMGAWAGYTGRQVSLKAKNIDDYWLEVEEHRRRAKLAAHRWRAMLALVRDEGV